MKYCEYCGSEAQNYFSNCHSCGAPFSIKTVYRQEEPVQPNGHKVSAIGFDSSLAFEMMPLLVSMMIIGYAVDKIGNLFRFRKKKVSDVQPARYTYEKRRGYL